MTFIENAPAEEYDGLPIPEGVYEAEFTDVEIKPSLYKYPNGQPKERIHFKGRITQDGAYFDRVIFGFCAKPERLTRTAELTRWANAILGEDTRHMAGIDPEYLKERPCQVRIVHGKPKTDGSVFAEVGDVLPVGASPAESNDTQSAPQAVATTQPAF